MPPLLRLAPITPEGEEVDRKQYLARWQYVMNNWRGERWRAQPENTIGGWCITVEKIPGTPADGNPPLADFSTEEVTRHLVALHNNWLEDHDNNPAPD